MNVCNFNHTHTQRYGGLITYWKLYAQILQQTQKGISLKIWSTYETITVILDIIIKTPWWLFIKPLGCPFSKKTISKGLIQSQNNTITKFEGEKLIILKFLAIPFFAYTSTKFTEEEKKKLID